MPIGKPKRDPSISSSALDPTSTSMELANNSTESHLSDSKPGLGKEDQLDAQDLKGILVSDET